MDEKYYEKPIEIKDDSYRYDSFENGEVLFGKKGRLPAMGWNSWNAFGSGNTEALTKIMADKLVELGLDKLGYQYVILDDGCYAAQRVDGHLTGDPVKFPGDFGDLSDYIHGKGLKFGMYNDIGSKLCSGLEVGTCGYEDVDTADYIKWGVDFIKVDNCYNVWDNATFSNPENARFTFAPAIKGIKVCRAGDEGGLIAELSAVKDGVITGNRAYVEGDYVVGIGTFDGTAPDSSPVGCLSSELHFNVNIDEAGEYNLFVDYRGGSSEGVGQWLQVAVENGDSVEYFHDDFIEPVPVRIRLGKGSNLIRLMNHRRQENTLLSYAKIQEHFNKVAPDNDIIFSICEWGKTQPQNWGYKVGDYWRILNDITFQVGADGDPGHGVWEGAYTTSVTAQYNKAVIMDEFAGLDKGWNDPDMLMIGMDGLNNTMCQTHMAMWCMLNAPLMLGLDLRRVEKDDEIYKIISNKDLIALNQDSLGIQAKRIFTTKAVAPDTAYVRDNDRIDVLAKPLSDGSIALSFINVSMADRENGVTIDCALIENYLKNKMVDPEGFFAASGYEVTDLWTGEKSEVQAETDSRRGTSFSSGALKACGNLTIKVKPVR